MHAVVERLSRHLASEERAHPDADLVQAARAGERPARELLFRRHLRMAYGMAFRLTGRREEVEDIVQDSFVQALASLHKLAQPEMFGTWLGQIIVHTVYRMRRRERLLSRLGLRAIIPIDPATLVAPAASPEARLELEAIYRRMDSIPAKWRLALIMRRVEGRQIEDIAELLCVSTATIKRWLTRAGEQLQKVLADMNADGGGAARAPASDEETP